jgi:hypothetical protein
MDIAWKYMRWTQMERLQHLRQLHSELTEDIRKGRRLAGYWSSIAQRWRAYVNDARNPDMREMDLLQLRHFQRMSALEEDSLASRLEFRARVENLMSSLGLDSRSKSFA